MADQSKKEQPAVNDDHKEELKTTCRNQMDTLIESCQETDQSCTSLPSTQYATAVNSDVGGADQETEQTDEINERSQNSKRPFIPDVSNDQEPAPKRLRTQLAFIASDDEDATESKPALEGDGTTPELLKAHDSVAPLISVENDLFSDEEQNDPTPDPPDNMIQSICRQSDDIDSENDCVVEGSETESDRAFIDDGEESLGGREFEKNEERNTTQRPGEPAQWSDAEFLDESDCDETIGENIYLDVEASSEDIEEVDEDEMDGRMEGIEGENESGFKVVKGSSVVHDEDFLLPDVEIEPREIMKMKGEMLNKEVSTVVQKFQH